MTSRNYRHWKKWFDRGVKDGEAGVAVSEFKGRFYMGDGYDAWISGWWQANKERESKAVKDDKSDLKIPFIAIKEQWDEKGEEIEATEF